MLPVKLVKQLGRLALGLVLASSLAAFAALPNAAPAENPYQVERSWPDYFLQHKKLFTEQAGTYKAGKHPVWTVHVPDGWIGNSTIIEGKDGLIVYDTSVNAEAGAFIAAEIRKISDKPIKAIFYSHHHGDHYGGTSALVTTEQVASGEVKIYAWDNFEAEKANEFGAIMPRQIMGVLYYGPDLLKPEEKHYHGCCSPKLLGGTPGYIPPTDTLSEDTEIEIAGIKIKVFYTGGEAISEFGLHIPEFDMVLIGDEFFYALANVHSIRGSKPRLPENYLKALDLVRAIQPEWLLGSHIMPMQGREKIHDAVTSSRDAIQYLWDQSIRYINKGYTAGELQHKLKKLPTHLDAPPYTRPMYGAPWIIAPEIFTGWVSWFNGDAADLLPTEPVEKARRYVRLMGGRGKVLSAAEKAFTEGDGQFAAELTQMLVRIDHNDWDARNLKAASLRQRGYAEINSIARAWYLKGALELEGKINPGQVVQARMRALQSRMTGIEILTSWRYQVDADKAAATRLSLGIQFTDSNDGYWLQLRNSVLEIRPQQAPKGTPTVSLSVQQLRSVIAGKQTNVQGDADVLAALMALLDLEQESFSMHLR